MSLTLGEKLRQAREERGISISEVSEQTRISSLYLAAIEDDNYKTLPGGIFNKGFVKSYAKFIGFDEQEALQDYSKLVAASEGTEDDHLKPYRPEVLTDDRPGSSIIPTVIFAVVILTLMTVGILYLVRYIQDQPSEPPAVANKAVNTNTPASANIIQTASSAPAFETIKVEFKTTGEDISLTVFNDGKKSYETVTLSRSAKFEPKQQLKLSYSRSKVQAAQLTINGKVITLPSAPENPKRAAIEFDINKDNLAQIWQNGAITIGSEVPAATPVSNANSNLTAAPSVTPIATISTPRPAAPKPSPTPLVKIGTPIPQQTPIIVGKPTPKQN